MKARKKKDPLRRDIAIGAATGAGVHLSFAQAHPLVLLGVHQNVQRLSGKWTPPRYMGARIADAVDRKLPTFARKIPGVSQLLNRVRQGRKMSLYHATWPTPAAKIRTEGLRAGRGGGFNVSRGQIFLGRPLTVAQHGLWAANVTESPHFFKISGVRRGQLVRDWQHAGAYVFKGHHIPVGQIREISTARMLAHAGGELGRTAALTGLGAYGFHKFRDWQKARQAARKNRR